MIDLDDESQQKEYIKIYLYQDSRGMCMCGSLLSVGMGGAAHPRIMQELSMGVFNRCFHWFIHALVVWVNLWEPCWKPCGHTPETLDQNALQ